MINANDTNMHAQKAKIHRAAASTPNKQSSVSISTALGNAQSIAHVLGSPRTMVQLTIMYASAVTGPVDSGVEVDEDRAAIVWYDRTAADEAHKQHTVLNAPSTVISSSKTAAGAATTAAGAQHGRRRSLASS